MKRILVTAAALFGLTGAAFADVTLTDGPEGEIEVRRKGGETTVIVPEGILESAGWRLGPCPAPPPCPEPEACPECPECDEAPVCPVPEPEPDPEPLPPEPKPEPPVEEGLALPPAEGEILWSQDWRDCRLQLRDPPWTKDVRGAVGLNLGGDELCANPGRIRGGTPQSGTLETIETPEGPALQILSTREQFQTRAEPGGNRNHTNFEISMAGLGRSLAIGGSYRLLFWANPAGENFKAPDPKWMIAYQLKSIPDGGEPSTNPTLTLMLRDGAYWAHLRADNREPMPDRKYDVNRIFGLGPIVQGQWELWEYRFDLKPAGGARLEIRRNGKTVIEIGDTQLGFRQKRGPAQLIGVYFNFDGTAKSDAVRMLFGPARLERL